MRLITIILITCLALLGGCGNDATVGPERSTESAVVERLRTITVNDLLPDTSPSAQALNEDPTFRGWVWDEVCRLEKEFQTSSPSQQIDLLYSNLDHLAAIGIVLDESGAPRRTPGYARFVATTGRLAGLMNNHPQLAADIIGGRIQVVLAKYE